MKQCLYGVLVLILCASFAFAGGKLSDRTTRSMPAHEAAPSLLDAAKITHVPGPPAPVHPDAVGTYTTLGGWWDYQGNGGSTEHIRVDPATGKIHVIMMIAEDSAAHNSARRTAYAVSTNDGATWNNFSNVRVPPIRSGYPSMDLLRGPVGVGSPLIVNHNVGGGTDISTWAYVGDTTGFFTELSPLPVLNPPVDGGEAIWPRIASGTNGELLVFASVNNTTDGVYRAFITRTTDFGTTWTDPWLRFPTWGVSGGSYTIQANGTGRVAALGKGDSDTLLLWESTNDGATWPATGTTVYPPFRYVGAETLTSYESLDMTYFNGQPLVAVNSSRVAPDGGIYYAGSRIEVWSPALGFKTAVPWDSLAYPSTLVAQAFHISLGYPAIGVSGSSIALAYMAFTNNSNSIDSLNGRRFGDIFLTQSTDGGNTWALPVNITNTPQLDERYPSISRYNPSGFAYITWQEDTHPGAAARDEGEAPTTFARQKFLKVNLSTVFPLNDVTSLAVTFPAPSNAIKQGTSFTPKAAFRNIGLVTQSSIPVRYQILNAAQAVVYDDAKTIPSLTSGQTAEVTFASGGSSLTWGLYTTRAIVTNPGDVSPTNDTTSNSMWVIPVVPVTGTYSENFEDTAPETGGFGWWHAIVGSAGSSDWVRGTPAKTQQLTGAHGGTKCYVTKLTGNYSDGMESILGSPVFDLSAVTGNVRMEFWQNFVIEPLWDGMWLQYSTDAGATWIVADHNLASGPTWNTGMSTGWYNANVDSQVVSGAPPPPFWSDSTVLYPGHTNFWIKSATILPIGGYSDVRLRFYMSADAASNREGWAIDDVTLKVGSGTASVSWNAGWDMVSNPVQKPAGQDSVLQLFPASAFNYMFGFGSSGYFQTRTLANGPGYWGKFTSSGSTSLSGSSLQSMSAPVIAGWNMIGSMTTAVDTQNVYPSPYGSRASVYFGWNPGYDAVASLVPGKSYWVKSSAAGAFLYLPPAPGTPAAKQSASPLATLNTLTLRDATGSSTTLYFGGTEEGQVDVSMYEMPPLPPLGAFDARFSATGGSASGGETAGGGYMVQTHEKGALTGEFPVRLQSVVYPLTVSWNIVTDGGYRLRDGMGNKAFGAKDLRGSGSMVIRNGSVSRLVVGIGGEAVPTEYALLQNYPNPFNPSTTIKFALPEPSRVTVEVYNLLGQKVTTLMHDALGAGYHEVKWTGTASSGQAVGSGVYFVRFTADGPEGKSFSDIRKVMLMK